MENTLKEFATAHINELAFPLTITFEPDCSIQDLIAWLQVNQAYIDAKTLDRGAILIRGAAIDSIPEFEEVTTALTAAFQNYPYSRQPRRNLRGHVYISTEYDLAFDITLYNELSCSIKWPYKLYFGSVMPTTLGGETPLADSREILKAMNPSLLEEFETRKICYIHNLHIGNGMGPTWMDTFETNDRQTVEKYCAAMDIGYCWKDNGGLKLIYTRPATSAHPITGEKVWFNQADQCHPSHFRKEVYDTLMLLADYNEEELPLYACFGDGCKISEDKIQEVRRTIDTVAVVRPWMKGDFVILDNMLVVHGRKPCNTKPLFPWYHDLGNE
jgi:hypothetical protein